MSLSATTIQTFSQILQPQGIKVVTTGSDEIGEFLQRRYGSVEPAQIQQRWQSILEGIPTAKVIILGIPMDVGAGFERGTFKGPLGIRSQFLAKKDLYQRFEEAGVIDIGDIRINPSLISDDLLNEKTIGDVRRAREIDEPLPVSPISILEAVLPMIHEINPSAKVHMLGGDHSFSKIPVKYLATPPNNSDQSLGVIHFDAHTDLLKERDGLCDSFGSWAYWANEWIGRGGRLQQLGTRISGKTREHWESTLGLRQFWSNEISARGTQAIMDELVNNLQRAGVLSVYISNDVDGTDPRWVASTGTMVRGGMKPSFVDATIRRLAREFDVVGADITELSPPLKWHVRGEPTRSNQMAAHYTVNQIEALLGRSGLFKNPIPIPRPATEKQVWNLPPLAKFPS